MDLLWWKAAGVRALRMFCQTLVTLIGTTAVSIVDLDWLQMLGVAATAAVVSFLTSIAGLPEVDAKQELHEIKLSQSREIEPVEEEK